MNNFFLLCYSLLALLLIIIAINTVTIIISIIATEHQYNISPYGYYDYFLLLYWILPLPEIYYSTWAITILHHDIISCNTTRASM